MKIAKMILQAALVAQFGFFGISKIMGTPEMVETFTAFGYPGWFMVLTGLIEVAAAVGFAYGFINARAVYAAAAVIVCVTIGATISHIFVEGSFPNAVPAMIVMAQTVLMTWLHTRVTNRSEAGSLAVA